MTKVYTVHGTPTTGGGTVIANNPFIIDGKPLACVGDMATCTIPSHPPTVTIIGPGDPAMIVFGRPASLNGDLLSCGCRVLMSQSRMIRGDKGASSHDSGAPQNRAKQTFDEQICIKDSDGKSLANIPIT